MRGLIFNLSFLVFLSFYFSRVTDCWDKIFLSNLFVCFLPLVRLGIYLSNLTVRDSGLHVFKFFYVNFNYFYL